MGEKETMVADAAKASGGKKEESERTSNLNLSKSNREMAEDAEAAVADRATNLNSSRSNREIGGGDPGAAAINTSHSNIKNLVDDAGDSTSDAERSSNLNASKSNIERGGEEPDDPAAINNSKSNIKD